MISALGSLALQDVQDSAALDEALKRQVQVELRSGAQFVSDDQLERALAEAEIPASQQEEILAVNADARLTALRRGVVLLSLFVVLTPALSTRLPDTPQGSDAGASGSGPGSAAARAHPGPARSIGVRADAGCGAATAADPGRPRG